VSASDGPLGEFLAAFELTDEQLPRLALFLLAHALLDRWLIHHCATQQLRPFIETIPPPTEAHVVEARIDALVLKNSDGTFSRHLRAAKDTGLLADWQIEVCEEVNRGRDHFLHWVPGRFSVPRYRGLDVTSPEGLGACMKDVASVIRGIFGGEE
jgi:hypothetical protein